MNIWDILIILAVIGLIIAAIRLYRHRSRSGGCSCGCQSCTQDCGRKPKKQK